MHRKRWADLSGPQKAGIIIGGTLQIGLLVAGLWDVAHRKPEELRGNRRFWIGFMFVDWIGPLSYFAYGRKDSPLGRCCPCCRKTEEPAVLGEVGE
jgi:hypothetical protein